MSMTKVNWYPGHMKKTKDLIKENMQLIDIVLEVVDARIPLSSKNPDISVFAKNKKRVIVLNKSDLVEKSEILYWKKYFKENNLADEVLEISAETGFNIKALYSIIDKVSAENKEKMKAKGLRKVNTRLMVVGIPNVGKSRLINRIVGKSSAGVGNKPGFTRGKQWVRIKEGLELLDTPGILWPKFEDQQVGLRLALIGSIRDEILNQDEMAIELIEYLKNHYQGILADRYQVDENEDKVKILEQIALNRNCKMKGNELDYEKASKIVLEEFRNGKLGKISLETPEEGTKEA